jgi:hypothetical protein
MRKAAVAIALVVATPILVGAVYKISDAVAYFALVSLAIITLATFLLPLNVPLLTTRGRSLAFAAGLFIAFANIASDLKAKEEQRLAALKRTDPPAYLAALRQKDSERWLSELEALDPAQFSVEVARIERERAEQEQHMSREMKEKQEREKRRNPERYVELANFTWSKGGFGSVMEANFVIRNPLEFGVKDIEITCVHAAPSGTEIDRNSRTIYEVFPAKSTKRIDDVNMGFIHSQARRSRCRIVNATAM